MMFDIKQEVVRALAESVQRGGRSLGNVPALLERVIAENMWQHRILDDREIAISEFREFVTLPYPDGLGTTIETLQALCQNEPEIRSFLAEAKQGKVGKPPKIEQSEFMVDARGNVIENDIFDNIKHYNSNKPATGTSADYAYNRLREEAYAPDGTIKNPKVASIQKRVLAGEISPHRGMVEAGFRRATIAINTRDVNSAANTLLNNMDRELLIELIDILQAQMSADSN